MSVQDQYGNLVVRSSVVDASGNEVDPIIMGSNSVRHIVEVENCSTIPYDISVEVVLPQGGRGTVPFQKTERGHRLIVTGNGDLLD